ncbi:MAG: hypothetical protein Q9175_007630, partial [Cornicularia normoerica]
MPTPQWVPAEVLQLDPNSSDFTCVGYAASKGRQCHNPIARANRQEAAKVLREMSRHDPQSRRLDDQLEELASRLLCRRWHQNQAADMKGQWHRDIERYQAATVRAERSSTVRTPSASAHPTIFRNQATSRATGPTASSVAHSPIHGSAPATPLLATGEELGRRGNNDPNGAESGQQTNSSPASSSQQEAMLQERNHPENSSPVSPADELTAHITGASLRAEIMATRETISDERESVEHTLEAPTQEQPHEGSLHAHDRRVIE